VDAYVRDSGGPRQQASTDQQIAEIEAYCIHHSLQLRHKFNDAAKSGGSTIGRDDFNRMLDLTRRPEDRPQGILLWNYARFARDLDDAIYYKALLRNRGVIVHSLTDPIPEGQYGRIVEFFIDISNEEKRRQTSTDAKRGLRDLVTVYGCVPGVPPRGFIRQSVTLPPRRDGSPRIAHRWVHDPDLKERVRKAFEMRASGSTLAQIHTELLLFGSINSYKTFFVNRLYIGILEFGGLIVENYCEPIVDMATWNAVQKRIQEHARAKYDRLHPRRFDSPYILSGLVYCGECGSPMSANTVTHDRGRNEAYRCSRSKRRAGCIQGRIGRKTLEEAVLTTLRDYILLPDSLAAIYEIQQNASGRNEERRLQRLDTLRDERRKLSTQIANITRAIAERGHTQALLEKLTDLEARRAQANTEYMELDRQHFEPIPMLTSDQISMLSKNLVETLANAPADQTRQILRALIHKIVIKKEAPDRLVGSITYFTPTLSTSPPFENPPSSRKGDNLPIGLSPLGALLYSGVRRAITVEWT
jgi:DNA invertase Pin-like site-specific DNA recombinase